LFQNRSLVAAATHFLEKAQIPKSTILSTSKQNFLDKNFLRRYISEQKRNFCSQIGFKGGGGGIVVSTIVVI
jgi:hypothetical protein